MFAGLSVCEGLDSENSMFLIDYATSMEIISTADYIELFTVEMIDRHTRIGDRLRETACVRPKRR